jgi:hypothetical protein
MEEIRGIGIGIGIGGLSGYCCQRVVIIHMFVFYLRDVFKSVFHIHRC